MTDCPWFGVLGVSGKGIWVWRVRFRVENPQELLKATCSHEDRAKQLTVPKSSYNNTGSTWPQTYSATPEHHHGT